MTQNAISLTADGGGGFNAEALSTAELAQHQGITNGTAVAGKAVVLTTNRVIDYIDATVLKVGGVAVAAVDLSGVTASAAEINLIDGSVAGTSVASKALALGANKNTDILVVADGGFFLGAGAGTAVGATAAEINATCDVSSQVQAIVGAGAVTVDGTKARATLSGGAYAITLAVPGAGAIGRVLCIEYIGGDTDAVTLALTNVIGESGGSTATFNADGEGLVLFGTTLGWVVLAEFGGVTLA